VTSKLWPSVGLLQPYFRPVRLAVPTAVVAPEGLAVLAELTRDKRGVGWYRATLLLITCIL
jgi:hypothetical protein